MASSACSVGFEPTSGFDALAEIQGPAVDFDWLLCMFSSGMICYVSLGRVLKSYQVRD
jgi:hypothetical protein